MTALQDVIQAGIEAALLQCDGAGAHTFGTRGMATGGPDDLVIRLTVEDVARVAARAAERWAATTGPIRPTGVSVMTAESS